MVDKDNDNGEYSKRSEEIPDPKVQPEQQAGVGLQVSREELDIILSEHQRWLESGGKAGKQANLQKANLQWADLKHVNLQGAILWHVNLKGVNLRRANFQKAEFWNANLQGADLRHANLQGAILRGADLQEAYLRGVDFQQADLTRAKLQQSNLQGVNGLSEATLQNANFERATGLKGTEFAGADLSGTTLPKDIAEFKALEHVTEITKHSRNIFVGLVGACVYCWLTIATTSDASLILNSAPTPLPIIQTKVPLASFYLASSALMLGLYIYLHMYLQRMWEGLASLPAVFPDGRALDERAYPWLLTSMVRAHVPKLQVGITTGGEEAGKQAHITDMQNQTQPSFAWIQWLISLLSAWMLVPGTILLLWIRYLPKHHVEGTILLSIMVAMALFGSFVFYLRARATLRKQGKDFGNILGGLVAVMALVVMAVTACYVNQGWRQETFGFTTHAMLAGADLKEVNLRCLAKINFTY